jgi:hypothetical protein
LRDRAAELLTTTIVDASAVLAPISDEVLAGELERRGWNVTPKRDLPSD